MGADRDAGRTSGKSLKLALHGPMFCGKSTLARALMFHGFVDLDYTDWGKTLVARGMTALLDRPVSVAEVRSRKNEWRDYIIASLRLYGFDDGAGIEELLGQAPDAERVVFDNVRYPAQWAKLQRAGFLLVRLRISHEEQERRAQAAGMNLETLRRLRREEVSERPLPLDSDPTRDFTLDARGRDTEDLLRDLFHRLYPLYGVWPQRRGWTPGRCGETGGSETGGSGWTDARGMDGG